MFNQLTNECSIIHLDFFTQLLSWPQSNVQCLLRQKNTWDVFFRVYLDEFSAKDRKRRRFKNFKDFFKEISKSKEEMFNQLENECSMMDLDFFTQLLSWHPHYVLCVLRQRNAWDFFSTSVYLHEFLAKDRKAKTFPEFSGFLSRNFEEKERKAEQI